MTRKWSLVLAMLFVWMPTTVCQADDTGILETAGKILQVGIGARAEGMGEAMSAATDDVYSLYWNPAGLDHVRAPQVSYSHNLWLANIQDAFLCYAQPFLHGGIGVGVNYINFGTFDKYGVDADGYPVPTGEQFTPYTLVLSTGYGVRLFPGVDFGAGVKLISENADTFNGITLGADIGCQIHDLLADGLSMALMFQNLGIPMEGYNLPTVGKVGLAYRLPWVMNKKSDHFLIAVDANIPVPTNQPMYLDAGFEYWFLNTLAARVGYKYSDNNSTLGDSLTGLTAGIGVRITNITLDYAVAPMGELGLTHRISLTYAFDVPKRKVKKRRTVTAKSFTPMAQQGDNGEMLTPSISKLAMRKPLTVNVESAIDSANKSRVSKAVFNIDVKGDKQIAKWVLKILDSKGNPVWSLAGEGAIDKLEWNGNDRSGRPLMETIFCTYEFEAVLEDGSAESANGKVVEEGRETQAGAAENQTADQVKLATIYFAENSEDLDETAIKTLKNQADIIKSRPYIKVQVEGYTDAGAENDQSFLLSQKRVDSVSRYLSATFKIPLKTLTGKARGAKNPAASNQTEDGRKQNRRVEMTIIYKQ